MCIRDRNYISPVAKDSIEIQTAELLAGPDGAFVYKFITTDEYKKLRLHIYRYESGKLIDQDKVEMGLDVYKRQEKSALRFSLFIGFYRSTDTRTVCGWSFFIL